MTRSLVVRLDNAGDVLLAGPAVRALAATDEGVVVLCGPRGRPAAELLPGVAEVIEFDAPWIAGHSVAVDPVCWDAAIAEVRRVAPVRAAVLTSFHQSPLPAALLLRLAGVSEIAGVSVDHPGSLLDHRVDVSDDLHEVERGLAVVAALGASPDPSDRGGLELVPSMPEPPHLSATGGTATVVLCPGASVPARAWSPRRFHDLARLLVERGHAVLVCGAPDEAALTGVVADGVDGAHDLGGRTTLGQLAAVMAEADIVVTGNSGPSHLAAAVGVPVVCLYAPTVPARRWRPWRVEHRLLGRQDIPCAGCRAVRCPVPGHPCIDDVSAHVVAREVDALLAATRRELVR